MRTFKEFRDEIFEAMENKPKEWRKGQFVFNYVNEVYGNVARNVQFGRRVDCFYDDSKIEEFIKEAYDEYVNLEQSYAKMAMENLDDLYEQQKNKELEFYRKFIDFLAYNCTTDTDFALELIAGNEYNEYIGDLQGEWVIKNNKPHISIEIEGCKLTVEWNTWNNCGVWQQDVGISGDSYQGYFLFPKGSNKYFVVKFKG